MTRCMSLCAALLLLTPPVLAADQKSIDEAIARGAVYLKATSVPSDPNLGFGPSAMVGLALLEARTPKDDPVIAAITKAIRAEAVTETRTYQVALAIIYLDRLGDANDRAMIQILGCRLLAGQTSGGWNYTTFDAVSEADARRIVALVKNGAVPDGKLHAEAEGMIRRRLRAQTALGEGDNSNTQFATVGLWIARRHGVPCDLAFRALEFRYIASQSTVDHGWGYSLNVTESSPSMTCAGLLGLAVAKGNSESRLEGRREKAPSKPEEDDPFLKPPAKPEGPRDNEEKEAPNTRPVRERAIQRGLAALGRLLQQAPAVNADGGNFRGGVTDLYFAWSLERVATAFGLETIGGIDWYRWGCDRILPTQREAGNWTGNNGEIVATAFAILFLSKSNFIGDLSRQINGTVKDPGNGELRGTPGGGPPGIRASGTPAEVARGITAPGGPDLNPVRVATEADKIAEGLVAATDDEFPKRLKAARESRGGDYTAGLALAVPRITGKKMYQAREALADRLTRMTADTLKRMLTDRSPEIRRAAVLAVVMKDEKRLIPEVVERINDVSDDVVRAARASLKSYSGDKDYGPPSGATDDEKETAVNQWRFWWAAEGKNK